MPSFLFLALTALLAGCQEFGENPAGPAGTARAGGDQTSFVGSFALLDASRSSLPGEEVKLVEWAPDAANPEEGSILTSSSLKGKQFVSFQTPGVYKFTLQITCESGRLYSDRFQVTVGPRQASVVADVGLEIRVRCSLRYREGPLTAEKLAVLDTLPTADVALKAKITNLSGLEHCTGLRVLVLGPEDITDLRPLATLTSLEFLDLANNYRLADISPLAGLVNLQEISLHSDPITDISALARLTRLRKLYLMFTPISDITPLRGLVNLELLYLVGVGLNVSVQSVAPLANLTRLTELHLAGLGITDLSPLENLTELSSLDVSFDSLSHFSGLSRMTKLVHLDAVHNKLTDLSGIRNLVKLGGLEVSDNKITDISDLEFLPSIRSINLSENQVTDLAPLVNNPYIGKGALLFLRGNPLSTTALNVDIPTLVQRGVAVYQQ